MLLLLLLLLLPLQSFQLQAILVSLSLSFLSPVFVLSGNSLEILVHTTFFSLFFVTSPADNKDRQSGSRHIFLHHHHLPPPQDPVFDVSSSRFLSQVKYQSHECVVSYLVPPTTSSNEKCIKIASQNFPSLFSFFRSSFLASSEAVICNTSCSSLYFSHFSLFSVLFIFQNVFLAAEDEIHIQIPFMRKLLKKLKVRGREGRRKDQWPPAWGISSSSWTENTNKTDSTSRTKQREKSSLLTLNTKSWKSGIIFSFFS